MHDLCASRQDKNKDTHTGGTKQNIINGAFIEGKHITCHTLT